MSVLSVDDWNEFFYKVGEDFYDLVNGDGGDENTAIDYDVLCSYTGAFNYRYYYDSTHNFQVPIITDFSIQEGQQYCFHNSKLLTGTNNFSGGNYLESGSLYNCSLYTLNSFVTYPWTYSGDYYAKYDASNNKQTYIFNIKLLFDGKSTFDEYVTSYGFENSAQRLYISGATTSYSKDTNGYNHYFTNTPPTLNQSTKFAPYRLVNSPLIINSTKFNTSINNTFKNSFNLTNTTYNTYTYNLNDNSGDVYINYYTDNDTGQPNGYIDINPTVPISFDDLFDMFNTVLAPLIGVGLDLPDWNDYLPPAVTGDINVNIDLPDVTGEYPVETITPIESDVYNIMSIDSMPQLPSLTGIDNGESAVALGASFTFLDGCGLLMPFITIAIIRLLISKFRGDS